MCVHVQMCSFAILLFTQKCKNCLKQGEEREEAEPNERFAALQARPNGSWRSAAQSRAFDGEAVGEELPGPGSALRTKMRPER